MSLYKDAHSPPGYDEYGLRIPKDRIDQHNASFRRYMSHKFTPLMNEKGEVDGVGVPLMPPVDHVPNPKTSDLGNPVHRQRDRKEALAVGTSIAAVTALTFYAFTHLI